MKAYHFFSLCSRRDWSMFLRPEFTTAEKLACSFVPPVEHPVLFFENVREKDSKSDQSHDEHSTLYS